VTALARPGLGSAAEKRTSQRAADHLERVPALHTERTAEAKIFIYPFEVSYSSDLIWRGRVLRHPAIPYPLRWRLKTP
jgi:hypothetical protein